VTATGTDPRGASESTAPAGTIEVAPAPDIEVPDDARRSTPIEIVVVAVVAVVVGVVFRFVARTPLWLDEALSVNLAKLPPGEIIDALRHDGHPPLYYFLLHVWMQAFGTSDIAVRALSGVISVITLPVAWFAARRRGGPMLGWVMVGVLSSSAFAVRYASETRMYSLVILLVLIGYLLIDDVVRRGKTTVVRLVALGVVTGLLLLTHYWGMFIVASIVLVCGWLRIRRGSRPALAALIAMVVGSIVMFGPWLPIMKYQAAHTGTPWAAPFRPTTTIAVSFLDFYSGGSELKDAVLVALASALLLALGLFGIGVNRRRIDLDLGTVKQLRFEGLVAALTLGIGIVAGLASKSAFASRYGAVFFPLVLLLIAAGVTRFVSRTIRAGVFAGYLALSMIGVIHVALVYQRSEARALAPAVAQKAKPGDLLVYCPDQLGPAGQREMPADVRQISYPTLGPPDRVDWVDYGERNAKADPKALAQQTLDIAGPDHAIFVMWSGTYKTFEGQCEDFVNAISAQRPMSQTVGTDDSAKYFEHANLSYFGPSPPTTP
jgi:mannosyltransferase